MQSLNGKRLFPASVAISLAGHVHLFEAIGFVTIEPIDKCWSITSWDRHGTLMKRCALDGGKLACGPESAPRRR
jgi:hypothetical protein